MMGGYENFDQLIECLENGSGWFGEASAIYFKLANTEKISKVYGAIITMMSQSYFEDNLPTWL